MTTHESIPPFQPRVLITAGPTREPIDDVRFIGNRSSGSLGVALATSAADRGLPTTLALGRSVHDPNILGVTLLRFDETTELSGLLADRFDESDIVVMAAAVADHTPAARHRGKLIRNTSGRLSIELVPTPDLLAAVSGSARPDQLLVGFALEPAERLESSARRKLTRKGADVIVANPLGTMESDTIDAALFVTDELAPIISQPEAGMPKRAFAEWLWPVLLACHQRKSSA
ncbi:MAG: phosphopantothenoylcysteine decarboxylase [Planctomycetota bacterium]